MAISAMHSTETAAVAAAPGERELKLTPDEALQLAIEHHRRDELDDAETIYKVLLAHWPDHVGVLSHMGVLANQRERHDEALGLLQHALKIAPDSAGLWNNLGNVLLRLNRVEEAEQAFRHSLRHGENPQALANLSRLLRKTRQWDESLAASRRAIEIDPDFSDAWHHLALALIARGQIHEGCQAATRATMLLPTHKRRRDSHARALVLAGELERAATIYREWLAEEPDNAYVQHHLAACTAERVPERASDAYVEQVFDDFAKTFDAKLASLSYRAPQLVSAALKAALPTASRQFDIADLGCGTGLCGPLVHPWARSLSGCDLSSGMLAQAAGRGVYDVLEKVELVQFLDAHRGEFDLVISADTLCYFGDLQAAMAATRASLRAGGRLVFTVEAVSEAASAGYRLLVNGRYAHGRGYVERMLAEAGLRLHSIAGEVLRQEFGLPVNGWVVSARLEA